MEWTAADIPDQTGRVAVVTGANGGLGYETALALAGKGAHVVMAARNRAKADAALAAIVTQHPSASVELVELDLSALDSVRTAAATIAASHDVVDILVNNAGVMAIPQRASADGFEMQWATNHLGHFALTAHLLPNVLRAPGGRVVTVTSTAHHMGWPVGLKSFEGTHRYGPWLAYGRSKLANFNFAIGLQRQFDAAGVATTSLAAHPGLTNSDLQATSATESGGLTQRLALTMTNATGMTTARGALPQLRAATDPAARGGEFYAPRFVNSGPPVRRPILRRIGLDRAIADLWTVSEQQTATTLRVAEAMS